MLQYSRRPRSAVKTTHLSESIDKKRVLKSVSIVKAVGEAVVIETAARWGPVSGPSASGSLRQVATSGCTDAFEGAPVTATGDCKAVRTG